MQGGEAYINRLKELKVKWGKTLRIKAGVINMVSYNNEVSVAQVANWQEFGTEHIPPRPFLRPTLKDNQGIYTDIIKGYIKSGDSRNSIGLKMSLLLAGDIKETISNIHDPVLVNSTIRARKKRGNTSIKPLVDTGILLSSIQGTYT